MARAIRYDPVLGTADMQERGEAQRAGDTVARSGLTPAAATTVSGHEAGARSTAEAGEYRPIAPVHRPAILHVGHQRDLLVRQRREVTGEAERLGQLWLRGGLAKGHPGQRILRSTPTDADGRRRAEQETGVISVSLEDEEERAAVGEATLDGQAGTQTGGLLVETTGGQSQDGRNDLSHERMADASGAASLGRARGTLSSTRALAETGGERSCAIDVESIEADHNPRRNKRRWQREGRVSARTRARGNSERSEAELGEQPARAAQAAEVTEEEIQMWDGRYSRGLFEGRDLRPPGLVAASDPAAWRREWHERHPGQRMCPGALCARVILPKYVLSHHRSGAPRFGCNAIMCRECGQVFCLTCGEAKGGGLGAGYHAECGRQPPWLSDEMIGISNDDPRVQQPPRWRAEA